MSTPSPEEPYADRTQAEVFRDITSIPILGETGEVEHLPTPYGVVTISQVCDIVRSDPETIVVAAIELLTADRHSALSRGDSPRLVAVPKLGPGWCADLSRTASVRKTFLYRTVGLPGVDPADNQATCDFGRNVGRCFSRFGFPSEVTPALGKIASHVLKKYDLPTSAQGWACQRVVQFRIAAEGGGWTAGAPYSLRLVVILPIGELPLYSEDGEDPPSRHVQNIIGNRNANRIAQALRDALPGSYDRLHLWRALADCWADRCQPIGPDQPIREITSVVFDLEDYLVIEMIRSSKLDVDVLSGAFPHGDNLDDA